MSETANNNPSHVTIIEKLAKGGVTNTYYALTAILIVGFAAAEAILKSLREANSNAKRTFILAVDGNGKNIPVYNTAEEYTAAIAEAKKASDEAEAAKALKGLSPQVIAYLQSQGLKPECVASIETAKAPTLDASGAPKRGPGRPPKAKPTDAVPPVTGTEAA